MSSDGSTVLFGALPPHLQFNASGKRRLTRFARKLSAQLARGKHFECLITDDRELRRLNSTFLGLDYPTDVLSFPSVNQEFSIGEIAISVERAEDQAREFGHTTLDEIEILMLHGILHLLGYDHEKDGGEMASAEMKWREDLKLPLGLLARTHGDPGKSGGAELR
jgi:probable rRNA maturation factor